LEWRIHLYLWVFLALIAYLSVTQNRHFGDIAFGLFLVVPLHFVWIVKIVTGEVRDQILSIRYRAAAEKILGFPRPPKYPDETAILESEEWSKMPRWLVKPFRSYLWWLGAEIGTTLLMCIGVIILVR
jgi:hypothetical protein